MQINKSDRTMRLASARSHLQEPAGLRERVGASRTSRPLGLGRAGRAGALLVRNQGRDLGKPGRGRLKKKSSVSSWNWPCKFNVFAVRARRTNDRRTVPR